jgi:hypothetical protein
VNISESEKETKTESKIAKEIETESETEGPDGEMLVSSMIHTENVKESGTETETETETEEDIMMRTKKENKNGRESPMKERLEEITIIIIEATLTETETETMIERPIKQMTVFFPSLPLPQQLHRPLPHNQRNPQHLPQTCHPRSLPLRLLSTITTFLLPKALVTLQRAKVSKTTYSTVVSS